MVRNDLIFRAQRRVGLIPANGLGVVRRAIFWSLFAWLLIAAWTWYQGRISVPTADESPLEQQRWSERRDVERDLVPDAVSDVDAQSLYGTFEKMRPIPLAKTAVAPLVLAAALPMIGTAAIQLPVTDLLKKLLSALI